MFIKPDEPSLCSIAMQTTLIDCCDLQVCMLAIGSPVGGVVGHTSTSHVLCDTDIVAPVTVDKPTRAKCPHGRPARSRCAECLGHAIPKQIVKKCQHDLIRSRCADCLGRPIQKKKPPRLCAHGRRRCRCVDCLGRCPHNLGAWACLDCGGTPPKPGKTCPHGKRKSRCLDCGGIPYTTAKICQHGEKNRICLRCIDTCVHGHSKAKGNCNECP